MREIKFRAWNNKDKEWLLGYTFSNLGGFSLYGETVIMGEWANVLNSYLFERNGYKHDDLKVMQYTGLKDKNGKEIYEGDILNESILVIWRNDLASFALSKKGWAYDHYFGEAVDPGNCEIIGNIYENPNLL